MTKQVGSILRKVDYDQIRRVVKKEVAEQISGLPTREEYFETSDKMMAELKAIREEFASHMNRHEENEIALKNITHKVKNLYKVFEIPEPADVVTSY